MRFSFRWYILVPLVTLLACESERLSDSVEAHLQEPQIAPYDLPSGKWIEEDGARICDGYLTRRADQDFCAAEVPSDWVPFEFDGKTYYIQPLAGQDL